MSSENDSFLDLIARGNTLQGLNRLFTEEGAPSARLSTNRALYGPAIEENLDRIREEEANHLTRLNEAGEHEKGAILYNLGCFALVQDDILTAQMRFEDTVKLEPDNLMARHNLAYSYDLLAQSEEAKAGYASILEENPGCHLTRLNLAQMNIQEGGYDTGLEELQALHREDPANMGVILYLCRGLLLRCTTTDLEQVLTLIEGAPETEKFLDLQECHAYALYLLGETERAEAAFEKLLASDGDNLFARLGLIKILSQRKDFAGLKQHVERYQALDPSDQLEELLQELNSSP